MMITAFSTPTQTRETENFQKIELGVIPGSSFSPWVGEAPFVFSTVKGGQIFVLLSALQ